ncbi:MAG TPA: energy transducer TonB, partial [Rudaea sp.]|nr:energy transducer TonB [Rudaea sp.]
ESVSDLVRLQPLAATASLAPAAGPKANSVQHLRQPIHMVAPVYPSRAMLAGITGNVELAYSVDSRGHVRDIRVVQASPPGVFELAAKTALGSWAFPVSASGAQQTQKFSFTLKEHESSDKCQQLTGSMICRQPGE